MESLSEYMLLEIFNYLDPASLKNCTEVSKRWDTLISRSASTMDKLTLKVDKSSKLRDLRDIKRRYSNMAVYQLTISPQLWSLLMNCQQQLRKLELNAFKMTESNFKKILQSMPSLHELKVHDCNIKSRNGRRVEAVKMPALQKLTIDLNDSVIFECIDMSTLKKIEIECYKNHRFIDTFEELQYLTVTMSCAYVSIRSNFQLKKIRIRSSHKLIIAKADQLISTYANTLERLEINWPEGEEVNYDLTNVAPSNSLSTASLSDLYSKLLDNVNALPALVASTAKYYFPQMKLIKVSNSA